MIGMSKRTRYADNSKRRQPVQQQRAEAARQATSQAKAGKRSDRTESPDAAAENRNR
jgi:hypothetical protein